MILAVNCKTESPIINTMTEQFFDYPAPFISSTKKKPLTIELIKADDYKNWLEKQSAATVTRFETLGLEGKPGQAGTITNTKSELTSIIYFINQSPGLYDGARIATKISNSINHDKIKSIVFKFKESGLSKVDLYKLSKGWALECYQFGLYKTGILPTKPKLLLPKSVDKKKLLAEIEPVYMMRNIVNTPANDFGPDEMEEVCEHIADKFKTKIKVIACDDLLRENYPLIHTVGDASPRRPRLIELNWGKKSDPKVTLVGKGVCYDTGGLSMKSSNAMLLMRKDMSGAAHVLALAQMIIAAKLPVNLRVLIPTVDNDVSGGAMRPGDIASSRKGLTVEITNTDAEGRLILSDALTAASEDKPDLVIDFATLTGAKMAALGHDISAFFTNNSTMTADIQKCAQSEEDPLWPFPIYQDYKGIIESKHADLTNSALMPGDLLYSALYLYQFMDQSIDWVHLDIYAWEKSGRPGRSIGSKECGLRAMWAYLQQRYG